MALSLDLAQTILRAGITGAGLVLTAYGLTATHATAILERQIVDLREDYRKLKDIALCGAAGPQLKEIATRIDEKSQLPFAIDVGFASTFFLYCVSALTACMYIANDDAGAAVLVLPAFFIATIILTAVGLWIIHSIRSILKTRFEDLKRGIHP